MIECGNWRVVGDAEKGRKMWERNWRAGEEAGVTMRRAEEVVWSAKGEEKARLEWGEEEEGREVETDDEQEVGMAAMVIVDGVVESGGGDPGGPDEEEKENGKGGTDGGTRGGGEQMVQEIDFAASTEEDRLFGHTSGYPTARRPIDYRRELTTEPWEIVSAWFEDSGITVGPAAKVKMADRDPVIAERTARLFYTWKDQFVKNLVEMPPTDLVTHLIPTWAGAVPAEPKTSSIRLGKRSGWTA